MGLFYGIKYFNISSLRDFESSIFLSSTDILFLRDMNNGFESRRDDISVEDLNISEV